DGSDSRQRIAGLRRRLRAGEPRVRRHHGGPRCEPDAHAYRAGHGRAAPRSGRSRTISVPRMKWWPAPHILLHSKTYPPGSGARKVTDSSFRPRLGIVTFVFVPTIRKPCAVSSLVSRSSTSSPGSSVISDGVNAKRSAVM